VIKRIAYITDLHLDEEFPKTLRVDSHENWNVILQDISSRNIDEIVFGGDIGAKTSNAWFFTSLKNFKVLISLGNHDTFSEVIRYFKIPTHKDPNALFYHYEHDFYKFLFLDSSLEVISRKQLKWLQTELVTSKKILLFIHHPVLKIPTMIDQKFSLEGREKIQEVLQQISNDITIFCGHYHMNDTRNAEHITQYITPAASYQVEKDSKEIKVHANGFGYRIIELDKDQLSTEVIMF